jgi:pimeloyl-ACP methyl ester carboxylesterase
VSKRLYRNLGIGLGLLLALILALGLTVYIGGPPVVFRVVFLLSGTTNPLLLVKQPTTSAQRIPYGTEELQFGELRIPEGPEKHPVAILVHGGCWLAQLKPLPVTVVSLDLLRPLAGELTQAGIATWNVEYRRLGNPGGGWPGTYKDVSVAVDFLPTIAAQNNLDLSRVIVIGHSAGGQLALWLAGRRNLPRTSPLYEATPLPISGVVDIDGPPDLAAPSSDLDSEVCGEPVVKESMGGSLTEVPSRYREGSAAGLLPTGVRQELLYAAKNEFMFKKESEWAELFTSYAASAENAGDTVHVYRMGSAGHFDGINPKSKSWPSVMTRVNSLLHQQ